MVADPQFQGILRRFAARGMGRSEFDLLPMPADCTPEEAWCAARAIRRAQGIHYQDFWTIDGVPTTQWFSPTRSIETMLYELVGCTGVGSSLDRALAERFGRRFITGSLVSEVVAAVSCEGLNIAYEEARRICLGDAEPSRPVERLVANMHGLLAEILEGGSAPIDEATICSIYDRLTDGVDACAAGGAMPWGNEWPGDPVSSDRAISEVCAMMSGGLVDPFEHPIITSQRVICHFWRYGVFPRYNYVLGSLVCRLYMRQKGFPVFAYLPVSQMSLAWRRGMCSRPGVWPYHDCCDVQGLDYDWTLYWESCLRLLLDEVRALEDTVLRARDEDDRILGCLRDDHSFNHRQRRLLERAVLAPHESVRIEEHRARHDLAYSTARHDLMSLVEHGLFEMHYEGKAQVFVACDDFKRRLASRYCV